MPVIKDFSSITAAHPEEKQHIYSDIQNWTTYTKEDHEIHNPYLPERIIENLVCPTAKISVTKWGKLTAINLDLIIDLAFKARHSNNYDLSTKMRRQNS